MVKISKILSDKSRGIQVKSSRDYINLSRRGLSVKQLKEILTYTGISMEEMTNLVSLSKKQLAKYSEEKTLKTDISAHLIQIVDLYRFGYGIFEETDKFQKWMRSEIKALAYQKPIDLLDTPFGINDVRIILGRLEYGVYS